MEHLSKESLNEKIIHLNSGLTTAGEGEKGETDGWTLSLESLDTQKIWLFSIFHAFCSISVCGAKWEVTVKQFAFNSTARTTTTLSSTRIMILKNHWVVKQAVKSQRYYVERNREKMLKFKRISHYDDDMDLESRNKRNNMRNERSVEELLFAFE